MMRPAAGDPPAPGCPPAPGPPSAPGHPRQPGDSPACGDSRSAGGRPRAAAAGLLWLLLIALAIAVLHGPSIRFGLFLDDWSHFTKLREAGWSLRDLTDACALELNGPGTLEMWWLPPVTLRFFRPVSFGLMKLAYTLGGWDAGVMHALSLAWHFLACALLLRLLRVLGLAVPVAGFVALLMAIHPAHVATVQWIAAQTELMVTSFALASMLCYLQYRGVERVGPPAGAATAETGRPPFERMAPAHGAIDPPQALEPVSTASVSLVTRIAQRAPNLPAIGAVVFFVLALGCRENAILLPAVLAAVEGVRSRSWRQRGWALIGVMCCCAAVYLGLRTWMLDGAALPPRPYVYPPLDAGFARYVADKLCYYLVGEFLLVPCVPIGGLSYFRDHPLLLYGPAAALLVGIAALAWARRATTAGRLAPACLFLLTAPLLPVFESPHHLYLPGVGWAILMALLIHAALGDPRRTTLVARLRCAATGIAALTALLLFSTATYFFSLALAVAQATEDCLVEEVAAEQKVHSGNTIYFANIPMIGHYVRLAVEHRTGLRDLRCVALTWAPRILGVAGAAEWRQIDERTLELRVAGDRYFSGPVGTLVAEATGGRPILPPGEKRDAGLFHVEALEQDAAGVTALRITFKHRLTAPRTHVFFGSRVRWAYPLEFRAAEP